MRFEDQENGRSRTWNGGPTRLSTNPRKSHRTESSSPKKHNQPNSLATQWPINDENRATRIRNRIAIYLWNRKTCDQCYFRIVVNLISGLVYSCDASCANALTPRSLDSPRSRIPAVNHFLLDVYKVCQFQYAAFTGRLYVKRILQK